MHKAFIIFTLSVLFGFDLSSQSYRYVDLHLTDLVYVPSMDKIAAVAPGHLSYGNHILFVDPNDGSISSKVACGSEPNQIRLSDNGNYLYISNFGTHYVETYNLNTETFEDVIWLSTTFEAGLDSVTYGYNTWDIVSISNSTNDILVSVRDVLSSPGFQEIIRFTNGQAQSVKVTQPDSRAQSMCITEDGSTAWGIGNGFQTSGLSKYTVTNQGISLDQSYDNLVDGQGLKLQYKNGLLFIENGEIYDVSTGTPNLVSTTDIGQQYGTFQTPVIPAIDSAYFYTFSHYNPSDPFGSEGFYLRTFDANSFQEIATNLIPRLLLYEVEKLYSIGNGKLAVIVNNFQVPYQSKLIIIDTKHCISIDYNLNLDISDESICEGDTIILTADAGYSEYVWSNGASSQSIIITENSLDTISYRVMGTNGCLSEPSIGLLPDFQRYPDAPNYQISGQNAPFVCENKAVEIDVFSQAEFTIFSTGDTSQTLLTNEVGTFGIVSVTRNGCASDTSYAETFPATCTLLPKPTIQVLGDLNLCEGETTELIAESGFKYLWNTGDTSQIISPPVSGSYFVKYQSEEGCTSVTSDTIEVLFRTKPESPELNLAYNVIHASVGFYDSIQWRFEGVLIQDSLDDLLSVAQEGFYTAQVFVNGCASAISTPIAYSDSCYVHFEYSTFSGGSEVLLQAVTNPQNGLFSDYFWNTGETTSSIIITSPDNYCVTISETLTGCLSYACIEVENADQIPVEAQTPTGGLKDGQVILYDFSSAMPVNLDTLETNALGKVVFENIPQGTYILRAEGLPNTPAAAQYFPTYHEASPIWFDAKIVEVGGLQAGAFPLNYKSIDMHPTLAQIGPGSISGSVQNEQNLTQIKIGADGAGPPYPGVVILLLDALGNPILYSITDASGVFQFDNLPYGTYQLVVQVPGIPAVSLLVTIDPSNPASTGILFYVDEDSGSVDAGEPKETDLFSLSPNPCADIFWLSSSVDAEIQIWSASGVFIEGEKIKKGKTKIEIRTLTAGIYFLKLRTGSGVFSQKFIKI